MSKKVHPDNLPHLSEAKNADGSPDMAAITAGTAAWNSAIASGDYVFTVAEEHVIDEDNDLLVVVRKRVKK